MSTDKPKNIYQRIIEVQKKVQTVIKNETVKLSERDKGYKAVSHDDVANLLHLPLAEAGIVLLPNVLEHSTSSFEKKNSYGSMTMWYRTDIKINVKWINADSPDDFFESNGAAFALDTSDKSFAKAYSLALKIVLLKVHLLESRDGEEVRVFEEQSSNEVKKQTQAQPKQTSNKVAPKTEAKSSPLDFILDLGSIKKKKLGEVSLEKLKEAAAWLSNDIKENPKNPKVKYYQVAYGNIKKAIEMKTPKEKPKSEEPPVFDEPPLSAYEDQYFPEQHEPIFEEPSFDEPEEPKPKGDMIIKLDYPEAAKSLRGKKINQIPEDILNDLVKILEVEIHKTPKIKNATEVFMLITHIKHYLEKRG